MTLCVISVGMFLHTANAGASRLSGTVYCVDTRRPARLAVVRIDREGAQAAAGGVTSQVLVTGMDGSFESGELEPGRYVITATFDGYVNETHTASPPELHIQAISLVEGTEVELGPGEAVRKQIALYRGAALAGVIQYDDGSPAVGVTVAVDSADQISGGLSGSGAHGHAKTDDRGRYRISGLREGGYYVHTEPGPSLPVPIYRNGKTAQDSAVPIMLAASEEYGGADIVVPLSMFHTVEGMVLTQSDQRSVNGLQITLKSIGSPSFSVSAVSEPDGSFQFVAIPPGHYVIETEGASISVGVFDSDIGDVTLDLK